MRVGAEGECFFKIDPVMPPWVGYLLCDQFNACCFTYIIPNFLAALQCRSYYSHFTEQETEAQWEKGIGASSPSQEAGEPIFRCQPVFFQSFVNPAHESEP